MNLQRITHIIATGSVDGVLTTAALINLIGRTDVGVTFTQAFEVGKLDVSKLPANSVIAFVDLAVNNKDHQMTADFVARLTAAGHKLVAVIDEHSSEDWLEVLGTFDGLEIEPQSQAAGVYKSSGAILKAAVLAHSLELCDAADAGDRMDFTTHFGGLVNQAVKSDIANNGRRVIMAQHFAFDRNPSAQITEWTEEYDKVILPNHKAIVDAKVELGNGIVRVVTTGLKIDMTTLMRGLYAQYKVVVLEGVQYNAVAGKPTLQISFGTDDKSLDLLTCVRTAGVPALGGFAQKANVEPADEVKALEAIRALISLTPAV